MRIFFWGVVRDCVVAEKIHGKHFIFVWWQRTAEFTGWDLHKQDVRMASNYIHISWRSGEMKLSGNLRFLIASSLSCEATEKQELLIAGMYAMQPTPPSLIESASSEVSCEALSEISEINSIRNSFYGIYSNGEQFSVVFCRLPSRNCAWLFFLIIILCIILLVLVFMFINV